LTQTYTSAGPPGLTIHSTWRARLISRPLSVARDCDTTRTVLARNGRIKGCRFRDRCLAWARCGHRSYCDRFRCWDWRLCSGCRLGYGHGNGRWALCGRQRRWSRSTAALALGRLGIARPPTLPAKGTWLTDTIVDTSLRGVGNGNANCTAAAGIVRLGEDAIRPTKPVLCLYKSKASIIHSAAAGFSWS